MTLRQALDRLATAGRLQPSRVFAHFSKLLRIPRNCETNSLALHGGAAKSGTARAAHNRPCACRDCLLLEGRATPLRQELRLQTSQTTACTPIQVHPVGAAEREQQRAWAQSGLRACRLQQCL